VLKELMYMQRRRTFLLIF